MRFLFVVDPLTSLTATKDSSIAMMRAAEARGHEVWTTTVETLAWASDAGVLADAVRLQLSDDEIGRAHV